MDNRPTAEIPADIGELIKRDVELLEKLGWDEFVKRRRGRGDLTEMHGVNHPARDLLRGYSTRGVPVKVHNEKWDKTKLDSAVERGPHQSAKLEIEFLSKEFFDMINNGQWIILPYSVAQKLEHLQLSPPGVVPQRNRRSRWIGDYTYSGVNPDTLCLVPTDAMQYGKALDRYVRHILLADPKFGPVYMLKCDLADGYYRLNLVVRDIPKLALVFPTKPNEEPLIALPLVLPMGWKNSGPAFCAATETITDMANQDIRTNVQQLPHKLDSIAQAMDYNAKPLLTTSSSLQGTSDIPERNPVLNRPSPKRAAYVDIFVDDFIALVQGDHRQLSRVRRALFHNIDLVFRPLDSADGKHRREPISMKKLKQGDCSWDYIKVILGWEINSKLGTINLPPHRIDRLLEILALFPSTKKRTTLKTWQRFVGELRSMALAIPAARGMFSHMQYALTNMQSKNRVTLTKHTHAAIADFKTLANDVITRPTRLAELVPLHPSVVGAHDASGKGAGGVVFAANHIAARECTSTISSPSSTPASTATLPARYTPWSAYEGGNMAAPTADPALPPPLLAREGNRTAPKADPALPHHHPIVYRMPFPPEIRKELVSYDNPKGEINNSDLELAGSLLHHEAIVHHFDVRERTTASYADNTPTIFWQRKGAVTSISAPARLLRLQALHQRRYRYVPRHDFISGENNKLADDASRLSHLTDSQFLHYFNTKYPQRLSWRLWTPPVALQHLLTSTLLDSASTLEYAPALTVPQPYTGTDGVHFASTWPSTPYSKPSRTQSSFSKSSLSGTAREKLPQAEERSGAGLWKLPYGLLGKRSPVWGPGTHG